MDWLLVFGLLIPIVPGVMIGIAASRAIDAPRTAFLAELAIAAALATIAGIVWSVGFAAWVFVWVVLGAQLGAILRRPRPSL